MVLLSLACSEENTAALPAVAGSGGSLIAAAGSSSEAGGSSGSSGDGGSAMGGSAGSGAAGMGGLAGMAGSGGAAVAGSAGSGGAGGSVEPQATCPDGPFPAPEPGDAVEVCEGFDFGFSYNEGPAWVASHNAFFFTNFIARAGLVGDVIKYTPGGDCEKFILDVGCNGLAVTTDGNLIAACHKTRDVVKIDLETKELTPLASMYMGELLDTPNDLVMHSNGAIYFSNPPNELDGRPGGVGSAVFWIDPEGTLERIMQGGGPNGVALSPDESILYVANAGVWDIDENGVPSNQRGSFVQADGIAMDCAGNVYASGGSIRNPDGQEIGQFPSGTNMAFGGEDGTTLLVVGRGNQVRLIPMNLPGLP